VKEPRARSGQRPRKHASALATSEMRYRARRRFFRRDCRIFRAFRLGLEIAKVTLPTLRTFQPFTSGSLLLVSIFEITPRSAHSEYHEGS
jgi:hypothetical protein